MIGGGGAPQLAARRIEVTIAMTSYQSTSNMHWIVPTSRLQNGINRFVVCWSWNVHALVGILHVDTLIQDDLVY